VFQFLKVEEQLPRHFRSVQNLPPIPFEFPHPPRRRRLNTASYFEPTGSSEFVREPDSTENMASTSSDIRVEDLQAEGFVRPFNPPLLGVDTPVLVKIPDPRVQVDTLFQISKGLVKYDMAPIIEEV